MKKLDIIPSNKSTVAQKSTVDSKPLEVVHFVSKTRCAVSSGSIVIAAMEAVGVSILYVST